MAGEDRQSPRIIRTLAFIALAVALALVIGISTGFASWGFQPLRDAVAQILATETLYPTVTPVPTQEGIVDLYSLIGDLVAEAVFAEPATRYEVRSYKIEELSLPHPMAFSIDGETADVSRAWRITVTGGPFPVRAQGYYIWVDDTSLPAKEAAEGLIGFIIQASTLREGAKIGVSYGDSIAFRQQFPGGLDLQRDPTP
jgi:hypothetical protein